MTFIACFVAYFALFALPAWIPQIIAASISVRRGIAAYSQRRKGIFLPLPTYRETLKLADAKFDAFLATFIGKLIVYAFYGIMIFGPMVYADIYADPNEWIIRAQFPK